MVGICFYDNITELAANSCLPEFLRNFHVSFYKPQNFGWKEALGKIDWICLLNPQYPAAIKILRKLRKDPAGFSCPVFHLHPFTDRDITRYTNGGLGDEARFRKVLRVRDTLRKMKRDLLAIQDTEQRTFAQFLLFVSTHKVKRLTPVFSKRTLEGYTYPIASQFWGENQLCALARLAESGILHTQIHDKINRCPSCTSWMVNIRDACPTCDSLAIERSDLIHHFRCAYLGPSANFTSTDDGLVCPKCRASVYHEGRDHDRPGDVFLCTSCDGMFKTPLYNAKCFHCDSVCRVNELHQDPIYAYRVDRAKAWSALEDLLGDLTPIAQRENLPVPFQTINQPRVA